MGLIAHFFVEWLRTGLGADLCWGVPRHDAPRDFRKRETPPQTAKMKFFRHRLWIIAALAFAGWHWLQPHSRAHGYTRPAIEQGQAIEKTPNADVSHRAPPFRTANTDDGLLII